MAETELYVLSAMFLGMSAACFFLKKDGCVGYCEVTGERTNRGAALGLEIPCVYRCYGPQPYIDRLKELIALALFLY